MREIIGQRDKRFVLIVMVVSIVSMFGSLNFLRLPSLYVVGFIFLGVLGFMSLVSIVSYCVLTKNVVIKEGRTLIIQNGVRWSVKQVINIEDIESVKAQEVTKVAKETSSGNVILTVKSAQGNKDVVVKNVLKHNEVVEILASIIRADLDSLPRC